MKKPMIGNKPERVSGSVIVTWYGQAGFRLTSGDTSILIDCFLTTENLARHYPPLVAAEEFTGITVVLCTHEHPDHMDLPFLRDFCAVNKVAPIVVPTPIIDIAVDGGLDPARLIGAVPGQTLRVAGVAVHPLAALHGIGGNEPVVYEFAKDDGPARFLGYVMDIGEIRFYHFGDGLVYPELPAAIVELAPDVLMVPINGRDHMRESKGVVGNMNEAEAALLCAQVQPKYIIPMHYDMILGNTGNLGHFVSLVHEANCGATVVVPARARAIVLALP
jgi:L-ascorbate metabolism protein UlaG (beta-lactamase superfamily)